MTKEKHSLRNIHHIGRMHRWRSKLTESPVESYRFIGSFLAAGWTRFCDKMSICFDDFDPKIRWLLGFLRMREKKPWNTVDPWQHWIHPCPLECQLQDGRAQPQQCWLCLYQFSASRWCWSLAKFRLPTGWDSSYGVSAIGREGSGSSRVPKIGSGFRV